MIGKLALIVAVLSAGSIYDSYPVAKAASDKSKDNLIVIIGASWCSPCRKMKAETKANASKYTGVNIAFVDYNSAWGKKLYSGSSVPALIKFKWDGEKWVRSMKSGYQSQFSLQRWAKQ
jgi:thiol-disulfide isomerase/thioredoxin